MNSKSLYEGKEITVKNYIKEEYEKCIKDMNLFVSSEFSKKIAKCQGRCWGHLYNNNESEFRKAYTLLDKLMREHLNFMMYDLGDKKLISFDAGSGAININEEAIRVTGNNYMTELDNLKLLCKNAF